MYLLNIYTNFGKRPLKAENLQDLITKIKKSLKIDNFSLFSDPQRSLPLKNNDLKNNLSVYLSSEKMSMKNYKKKMCDHSVELICPNCASLNPLDRKPTPSKKIRYLSYKQYLHLLQVSNKKEENFDYKIKKCKDHSENVSCQKCIEKQITLLPQIYRHIDYIEFDNSLIVENFISSYKNSQRQQFALLVGKVKDHQILEGGEKGKKIVVSAIFYCEQENYPDGLFLRKIKNLPFDGLEILGLIYTDLFKKGKDLFSYKKRDNFFVSAHELNFFYEVYKNLINFNKNTKQSFVNICVTLDTEKNIVLENFMLTKQFIALMESRVLSLCTKPDVFLTKRDVVYLYRNEYDLDVSKKANPFVPVDYFFVKCEIGYKQGAPVF